MGLIVLSASELVSGRCQNLFAVNGELQKNVPQYKQYISLEGIPDHDLYLKIFKGKRCYDDFLNEAVQLASIYIRAAYEIYRAPRADDCLREAFLNVVANADLGVPLQLHILQDANKNFPLLRDLVDERWATVAARQWLVSVDGCQHAANWDAMAGQLTKTISTEAFIKSVMAIREQLGGVASRELDSAACVRNPQGDPDGKYVVVQFKTSFEKKQLTVEKVTASFDEDGKWTLFAYDIE